LYKWPASLFFSSIIPANIKGDEDCDNNEDQPPRPVPVQEKPIVPVYYPLLGQQQQGYGVASSQQQQQPPKKYTGPLVTEEETRRLHAEAIAQQEQLIRQQEAINAAGPATMGPNKEDEDCSDEEQQKVQQPAPIQQTPVVWQQTGVQQQQQAGKWETVNVQQQPVAHQTSSQIVVPQVRGVLGY
jgi:hypothetical protein